ncbi:DUF5785 family protein [Haloarchaeobius sp. DFWS5]|uniref:DUF5785 family protein n=1 Tax=Haloarchaeobius sp. DFWS5 TaxID=3446114 RepID=UPI003EBD0A7E
MTSDWPHDPDGEEGSEGMRKYGMAILAKKLDEDEDFPLAKTDFVEAHSDEPIRLNSKRVVSVADIFEHVTEDEFEDMVHFHKAVGKAMRSGGFWEFHPKAGESNIKHA